MLESKVNKDNPRFGTTKWTVVLRARDESEDVQRQSWNDLVDAYWYPLYAFARRKGHLHQDAQDLTQGFFTHLLSASALDSVSPLKGRFRSFLLVSFRNFIANERRAANTQMRGGTHRIRSLNADDMATRFARTATGEMTPEQIFDRSWVESILLRVREKLAKDYQKADRSELFQMLEPHLMMTTEPTLSRADIGTRLGLSPAAIAMSIHRMRRRFGEILKFEVSLTVDDPNEIEDELKRLMSIVSGDS